MDRPCVIKVLSTSTESMDVVLGVICLEVFTAATRTTSELTE
jgi:hypothetical protein